MTNKVPPPPTYLSDQAKVALTQLAPQTTYPDQGDLEGWLALVASVDGGIRSRFEGVDLPVETTKESIGGIPTFVVKPLGADDSGTLYLNIHGGALMFAGGDIIPPMTAREVMNSSLTHWAPDYRMPPLHPYPAGLDDVVAVYRAALETWAPENILVGGGSAGANLAAALLLRAKDEGLPMPAGLLLLMPELDLTESGDSFITLADASVKLSSLGPVNRLYAGDNDLEHPYLSPLFGDVHGFPPTLLTVGTRDIFLSNAVRMHRKLRSAGVAAELNVFDAMPHGGFGGAPEDADHWAAVRDFIARQLTA
jgi:monoterpene epsilon-lactone hydrolase